VEKHAGSIDYRPVPVEEDAFEANPSHRGQVFGPALPGPLDHRTGDADHGRPGQRPFPEFGNELVDRWQMTALHVTGYILAL
jgi:hypothetical protein